MLQEGERRKRGRPRGQKSYPPIAPNCALVRSAINRLVPPPVAGLGRRKALLELFDNRISWRGIQHWLSGRAAIPHWAAEMVDAKLQNVNSAIEHERAMLQLRAKEKAPNVGALP